MALALGVDSLATLADRVRRVLKMAQPGSLADKIGILLRIGEFGALLPRVVRNAPCQIAMVDDQSIFERSPS